ncbi:hypothetical protein C8255_00975 [filamentous cyanobacterium CCP3]|nr:hypothetical protein C8255_00975 [filamentous cyanobacterium CCP3]
MHEVHKQNLTFQSLHRPLRYKFFNTLGSGLDAVGLSAIDLEIESLLEGARKLTQLDDFGNQDFYVPLTYLIESLRTESQLNFVGKYLSKNMLTELLSERLRAQQYFQSFPEVFSEKIYKPLFVIGMPRSGTSFLFNLLCQDPNSSWIKYWELHTPSQHFFQGEKPDYAFAENALIKKSSQYLENTKRLMPQLDQVHSIDAVGPYECFHLLERSFVCHTFGLYANVPTYIEWIESEYLKTDTQLPIDLYQYYYKQIQLIKNLRNWNDLGAQATSTELEKHWVFKSPVHLWSIDNISNTIPDAHFVHIHRDPLEVIPSICSFIALGRAVLSDQVDLENIGKQALKRWSEATARALSIRQKDPSLKVIDIHYKRFVSDPVETIRNIYYQFDYNFTPELENSLRAYISKSRESKRGQQNKYSLEQFGLEEGEVRERFHGYYQFMNSI